MEHYRAMTKRFPRPTSWLFFYVFIRFPLGIIFGILNLFSLSGQRIIAENHLFGIALEQEELLINLAYALQIGMLLLIFVLMIRMIRLTRGAYLANMIFLGIETLLIGFNFMMSGWWIGNPIVYFIVGSVVWGLVWMLPNVIYFKKRTLLFTEDEADPIPRFPVRVVPQDGRWICPKCGLQDNVVGSPCATCRLLPTFMPEVQETVPSAGADRHPPVSAQQPTQVVALDSSTRPGNETAAGGQTPGQQVEKICPQCGAVYDASCAFCPNCGVPLQLKSSAPPQESSEKQPDKFRRWRWLIIGLTTGVLVVGIICALMVVYSKPGYACTVAGCNERVSAADHAQGRLYCANHACSVAGCLEPHASGSSVCTMHQNAAGSAPDNYNGDTPVATQEDNRCQAAGCGNYVLEGESYCAVHRCNVTGCHAQVDYGSFYCKEHCCQAAGCSQQVVENKSYCQQHACPVAGCMSEKISYEYYCAEHQCGEFGCSNQAESGKDYCEEHLCHVIGCSQHVSDGELFCDMHRCDEFGCHAQQDGASLYCVDHRCEYGRCISGKSWGSDYCFRHERIVEQEQEDGYYY